MVKTFYIRENKKIKCVTPEKVLSSYLPIKMHNNLLFSLCRPYAEFMCQEDCKHADVNTHIFVGTQEGVKLKKAMKFGYVITKVFETWSYKTTRFDKQSRKSGLFHENIDKFLAEETYALGYLPECRNGDDNKQAIDHYIRTIGQDKGIKLDESWI